MALQGVEASANFVDHIAQALVAKQGEADDNAQLSGLKQAADVLIHQDPCFQQFIRDTNGQPTPAGSAICGSAPAM
jgi:hypothetical protein